MTLPRHAFFRGRIVPYTEAKVGVMTHALNYGTAVFGGLRAFWNADEEELFVFRPRDHFRRFLESARLLGMELLHTEETLLQSLAALLRAEGYREDCYARPLAFYSDEAIVLSHDGKVSEGTAANVFIVKNGVAITPPTTDNILEGITRATVLELLRRDMGLNVAERRVDRTEIYLADEAFFCGTGVQIAAITKVDNRSIGAGRIGPVVSGLRKLYFDVVRGRVPAYRHWCAPVYAPAREEPRQEPGPGPKPLRIAG